MEVHLTPELEALVESKASSGRYNSPTEVIKSALEILVLHDEMLEFQKDRFVLRLKKVCRKHDAGSSLMAMSTLLVSTES